MMFSGSVGSISLPDDDDAKALRTEDRMAFHVLSVESALGEEPRDTDGALDGCFTRPQRVRGALGTVEGVSLVHSFESECPVAAPELA